MFLLSGTPKESWPSWLTWSAQRHSKPPVSSVTSAKIWFPKLEAVPKTQRFPIPEDKSDIWTRDSWPETNPRPRRWRRTWPSKPCWPRPSFLTSGSGPISRNSWGPKQITGSTFAGSKRVLRRSDPGQPWSADPCSGVWRNSPKALRWVQLSLGGSWHLTQVATFEASVDVATFYPILGLLRILLLVYSILQIRE